MDHQHNFDSAASSPQAAVCVLMPELKSVFAKVINHHHRHQARIIILTLVITFIIFNIVKCWLTVNQHLMMLKTSGCVPTAESSSAKSLLLSLILSL